MRTLLRTLVVAALPVALVACESDGASSDESERAEATPAASQQETSEPKAGAAKRESEETDESPGESASDLATATLSVEEMVCEGCARAVSSNLEEVSGVSEVSASFEDDQAEVTYDPDEVQPDAFVEALSNVEMSGQTMEWDVEVVDASTKGETP